MTEPSRFVWVVDAAHAGARLDRFLVDQQVLGTRSQIHRLITAGAVAVNGRAAKASSTLRAGARVSAKPAPPPPIRAEPEAIALDVLFEDEWMLAINKPPGLVVHPAPGHATGTLVNALLHRWPEPGEGLDPARLGIVHRLDKDTSGVLVIARTGSALAALGRQFRDREVSKQYLALVRGVPRPLRGVVDQPIGRHPVQRKRMAVRAHGRAATTRYEVLEPLGAVSLVRAYPETGRTHQIRVHLAAIGTPIIADPVYGRGGDPTSRIIGRQALHAEALTLRHPASGAPLRIEAPLAADFARALAGLGSKSLTS